MGNSRASFMVAGLLVAVLSCSSSKQSGSSSNGPSFDCYLGAGSTLTLAAGIGSPTGPVGCTYFAAAGGGAVLFIDTAIVTPEAGNPANDGALILYIQSGPPGAGNTMATSLIGGVASLYPLSAIEAALASDGVAENAIMGSVNTKPAGRVDWYDSQMGGGAATLSMSGGWPVAVGDAADIILTFEAASMRARTCAEYPNGGTCDGGAGEGGAGGGDGGPVGPAIPMSGVLKLHLDVSQQNNECLAPARTPEAGGAGCVDFDQSCVGGQCPGKCAGTECIALTVGAPPLCCIPNTRPCGSAGTGTECCSGQCSNEGTCGPMPNVACTSDDGGGAGPGGTTCFSFPVQSNDAQGNTTWVGNECQCTQAPESFATFTSGLTPEFTALITQVTSCPASDCCIAAGPTSMTGGIACQCENAAARQGDATTNGAASESCGDILAASAGASQVQACPTP